MTDLDSTRLPLAVYGSLRAGHGLPEAPEVQHALRARGPCVIRGRLVDLGDYPGLLDGPGLVQGELFEVLDPDVLRTLDAYEEYDPGDPAGSAYLRRAVTLLRPAIDAWVYIYNGDVDGLPVIASGDWAAHVSR
jgi:gamma-glutamylcyclotransferase (GGCT)/AIG2-like uncharacterized protein YtfP